MSLAVFIFFIFFTFFYLPMSARPLHLFLTHLPMIGPFLDFRSLLRLGRTASSFHSTMDLQDLVWNTTSFKIDLIDLLFIPKGLAADQVAHHQSRLKWTGWSKLRHVEFDFRDITNVIKESIRTYRNQRSRVAATRMMIISSLAAREEEEKTRKDPGFKVFEMTYVFASAMHLCKQTMETLCKKFTNVYSLRLHDWNPVAYFVDSSNQADFLHYDPMYIQLQDIQAHVTSALNTIQYSTRVKPTLYTSQVDLPGLDLNRFGSFDLMPFLGVDSIHTSVTPLTLTTCKLRYTDTSTNHMRIKNIHELQLSTFIRQWSPSVEHVCITRCNSWTQNIQFLDTLALQLTCWTALHTLRISLFIDTQPQNREIQTIKNSMNVLTSSLIHVKDTLTSLFLALPLVPASLTETLTQLTKLKSIGLRHFCNLTGTMAKRPAPATVFTLSSLPALQSILFYDEESEYFANINLREAPLCIRSLVVFRGYHLYFWLHRVLTLKSILYMHPPIFQLRVLYVPVVQDLQVDFMFLFLFSSLSMEKIRYHFPHLTQIFIQPHKTCKQAQVIEQLITRNGTNPDLQDIFKMFSFEFDD